MTKPELNVVSQPATDPTSIFDLFRGHAATELLTVAVHHLKVFGHLQDAPLGPDELRAKLALDERPFSVLITALRAFGLLAIDNGRYCATPLAKAHLCEPSQFNISAYIGLAASSPGVLAMLERMKSNRPANTDEGQEGAAFIYRDALPSAMDDDDSARRLTLALAGRARNVAPVLAEAVPLPDANVLLDVGGGTGLYAIAYLQRFPRLRAIVWDRPAVLKVASQFAVQAGVSDRLICHAGDMFRDEVPHADVALLSNVLHDWDVPDCRALVLRVANALPPHGRLIVHDVFLNDTLDGPLPVALYSADLFLLTEGRAYSRAEYAAWLADVGFTVGPSVNTLVHAGAMVGVRVQDK